MTLGSIWDKKSLVFFRVFSSFYTLKCKFWSLKTPKFIWRSFGANKNSLNFVAVFGIFGPQNMPILPILVIAFGTKWQSSASHIVRNRQSWKKKKKNKTKNKKQK